MAMTVKYPIGIQEFEKLRKEGFLYIDKTALVRKLTDEGCYYFLSRPRRFGKSLLLSTIKAYFEGKRELFKGLAIDTDEVSWEAHPVLHLEFKLDGTAEDALQQIQDKNYTLPFELSGQQIIRIGMNFSSETRNIDGVAIG